MFIAPLQLILYPSILCYCNFLVQLLPLFSSSVSANLYFLTFFKCRALVAVEMKVRFLSSLTPNFLLLIYLSILLLSSNQNRHADGFFSLET